MSPDNTDLTEFCIPSYTSAGALFTLNHPWPFPMEHMRVGGPQVFVMFGQSSAPVHMSKAQQIAPGILVWKGEVPPPSHFVPLHLMTGPNGTDWAKLAPGAATLKRHTHCCSRDRLNRLQEAETRS